MNANQYEHRLIGLGVMGENLVLNINPRDFRSPCLIARPKSPKNLLPAVLREKTFSRRGPWKSSSLR